MSERDHYHCPAGCSHPQPFSCGELLLCALCWHFRNVITVMVPCSTKFCGPLLAVLLLLTACEDSRIHDDPPKQVAITLIEVTGLDHETIDVNPAEIVDLRSPRTHNRILPPKANCALQMTDGKHITVLETCDQVRQRIDAVK
jgi:hypothetical protein